MMLNLYLIFLRRYVFWTDWALNNASVSRADLDGSNVRRLFEQPIVEWPNGLTIDFIAERLYWVDARHDYIASSDLDGKGFHKVIQNDVSKHISTSHLIIRVLYPREFF